MNEFKRDHGRSFPLCPSDERLHAGGIEGSNLDIMTSGKVS
jgi:hypothetical protein